MQSEHGKNILDEPPRLGCSERFSRYLELLRPKGGLVVALEAYLDETGRETGVFGVVAYMFEDEQARAFDTEWRNLFGTVAFPHG